MQVAEVTQVTDTADSGELFAGYSTYTDASEIDATFGQEEAVNVTPTIISTATILVSCLC
ncbi:LxmA leader domain family RiPP [Streptomyces sp. NPDC003006]